MANGDAERGLTYSKDIDIGVASSSVLVGQG